MMESNQASSLLEHKLDADTFICGLCKDQFHDYNVFIEHKRLHTAGSGNKLGVSKQLVVESPSMHNTRKRKTAQCLTTSKPSKTHVDSTADEMECSTRKVRKHTSDLLTKTSDRNTSVSVKVKRERFEDHKIGNQPNFTVSAKSETRTVPSNPQCVHTLHTRKSTRLIARQHRKAKKASFEPDVHEKSGARNVATACSTRTGVHVLKPESDLTRDQVDVRSQPIHVSDDGVVHEKLVATAMKTHHGLSRITTRQITAKKAVSPTDSTRQGISNASTQTNSCVEKTENGQPKSPCFRSQITVYMKAGIYTYQCDKCKEIFDTYIILRRHQRRPVKIEEATVQELESIPGDMVKRDSNRNITGKKGQIVTFIRDTDKPRRGRRPKFIPNVTICHGSKTALCLADGTFQCQQCKVTLKTLQEMEEHCSMRAVKDATGSTLSSKMGKSSTVDTGAGGDQVGSKGTLQAPHETHDAGNSTDGTLQRPHETPDAGNSKDGTLQGSHETPDAGNSKDGTLQGSHETPDAGNSKDGTLQGSHETPDAGNSTDGALQAPPEINHVNQSTNEHDTNADSSGSESPNFSVDSDCIEVIPVFDTQEEEDEFQDYCNSVDLSVVDGLFVRELVEQTGETAATRRSRPRDLVLYRCSVCSKFLSCRKKAREHCVHHADLSPFVCPRCGDQFKLKSNLTVHMRYHTGNMFKCSACPAEFARKDILRNHLTSMHVADGLDCRLCGRVMRSLPTLRNHVKIKHPGAAGRQYIASLRKNERSSPFVLHQCQFCSRYFKKASELDKHLVQHDANMRYRFACKLCDNVSTDAASLRKHCRMHSLVYACAECDGKCVSTLALMEHLTQHSRDKERVESLFRESINCSFYLPDRYIVNEDMKTTAVTDIINQLDIESNWLDDFLKHGATSPNVPPSPGTILIEQACEKASSTPPRLSTALQSLDNGQADVGNVHGSGSVTELKAAMNAENENVDDDDVATNVGYKACSNDWLSQYRKLNAGLLLLIRDLYGPLECEFCGILFCDEPHFHIHVQRHEKSSLKCHFPECKFVTPSKMSLKLHVESAHVKKSFSCVKCDHEAKGRVALWRHCKATHVNAMCCHICKQQFADHELLKSHFEEEHVDNDRRFTSRVVGRHHVCETCGKVFTRTNDLKRHEFWHKGVKPIKCTKANCHFSCRSKSHLSEHVRVKHANTTHLCHLCGVKYKSQRCLAAHVSVHETGAAYACAHCAYTGATEERLKQHLETHKLRVFRCRLCAYVVTTKVSITKHYKEVHPGAERDPEVVPVESIEEKRIYKRGAATVSPPLRRRPPRDEEEECEELQEEAGSVEGREEGELLCGELQLLNKLTSGAGLMPGQVLHCQYDADGSIQLIVADGALEEDGRYVVAEQQQQEEEEETHGNGMQDVFDAQHIITVKEEPAPLDEPMIIVFDGSSENQEQLLQQVVDGRLSLIGEDQLACLEAQVPTAGSHETIVTYVDQSAECIFESAEISADEQSSIDRTQTAVQVLEQLMSLTPSAAASSQISK
ncbi:PREDICTED: zinc finger protein 236-like [Priapulus caudatus]|uniref:Zinc finger protein 236-like n=1 Tax=Priapulus caudatus TaxID=37621 RepID=A0ABM1F8N6_PRICU|nr:PREDICTED: zinc finger protein 236-like [Priapulus caudatus]